MSCPALTSSPLAMVRVKGLPSNSTVSMPRCTRNCRPDSVLKPTAWRVFATIMTVPVTGATMVPPGGVLIPKPSPTDFFDKTGSGTSVISMTVPAIGATTSTVVGVVELVTMQLPLSSRSELHRGEAESCRQQGVRMVSDEHFPCCEVSRNIVRNFLVG